MNNSQYLSISSSSFEWNNLEICHVLHNTTFGKYIRHEVTLYNTISFKDRSFDAVYQTGVTYYNNDYSSPSRELALSYEAGTDDVLILVDGLWESDFNDEKQDKIDAIIEELKDRHNLILSKEELWDVYVALNENKPDICNFFDFSDDPNDYTIDECTNYAVLKNDKEIQ